MKLRQLNHILYVKMSSCENFVVFASHVITDDDEREPYVPCERNYLHHTDLFCLCAMCGCLKFVDSPTSYHIFFESRSLFFFSTENKKEGVNDCVRL